MSRVQTIIVVGGGIAGLCAALWLGGAGHDVTVLEHDDASVPPSVDEAWDIWDRGGAPQVRQPHVVLGRFCALLRSKHPHVYDALLAAGATEARFADVVGPESGYQPEAADEELTSVRMRRVTLEWVLRRAVLAQNNVRFRGGTVVAGLVADAAPIPHVTGVRLADGGVISADLTLLASGKRCKMLEWYAQIGARPPREQAKESGVVYVSRFYRLPGNRDFDRDTPSIITHGYLQGGLFEADNRTFSASITLPREDVELRKLLLKPGNFERMLHELPQYRSLADSTGEPISGMGVMAGVTNRWRDVTIDGRPAATGVLPIGDALISTNPVYGRGMSTAAWAVDMLASALEAHFSDPVGLVTTYAADVERELKPWYVASCQADEANRRNAAAVLAGEGGQNQDGQNQDGEFARMMALARYDAVVHRAFIRNAYLLAAPTAMMDDAELMERIERLKQRYPDAGKGVGKSPERSDVIAFLSSFLGSPTQEAMAR